MSEDNNLKQSQNKKISNVKIPMTLTIPDVVFIVAAVVSMVTAWGIFGTRLSVIEEKIIFISNNMKDIKIAVKDLKKEDMFLNAELGDELENLDIRLRNLEMKQAEVRVLLLQKKKKK